MTISMLSVISILEKDYENLTINELFYILTVIRDNCLNDETYEFINKILKERINYGK